MPSVTHDPYHSDTGCIAAKVHGIIGEYAEHGLNLQQTKAMSFSHMKVLAER